MAIYKLPPLVNRINGSRKGITIQKAGTNFIIRRRSAIVQKRSAIQAKAKSLLASRSQVWRSLSPAQQATWLAQVGNYTRVDSLGIPYNILANPLQIWTNVNAEIIGDPPVLSGSAPLVYPTYALDNPAMNIGISSLIMRFDISLPAVTNTVPPNFSAKVYFSPPVSEGAGTPSIVEFSLVEVIPAGTNTISYNFWNEYISKFPNVNGNFGQYFFGAVKMVSTINYIDDDPIFSASDVIN